MGSIPRLGLILSTVGLLAGSVVATAAPPVAAADPCRVRNITQDTSGRSFIRLVGHAEDGDELLVRGTCAAGVSISKDLTISGVGNRATLTGLDRTRVLEIRGVATVTLRDLRIVRGGVTNLQSGTASGILNRGTLTLIDSIVARNRGSMGIFNWYTGKLTLLRTAVRRHSCCGGLVLNGQATLIDSVVAHNVGYYGGGIFADSFATVTIVGLSIRDNRALRGGGGLYNGFDPGGSTVTLGEGTTVTGNEAVGRGGGVVNNANLIVDGADIHSNVAGDRGGGIFNSNGQVTLDGSASVTGNTPDDCVGTPAC